MAINLEHRSMTAMEPETQAAVALKALLVRIRDDDRVADLLGDGSQIFDLATEAYASLIGTDLAYLRKMVIGCRAKQGEVTP